MPFYKVKFKGTDIVDCSEVTKKTNLYEYMTVKQYKRFVHFDEHTKPIIFLCEADSIDEAKEMAAKFLEQ